MGFEKRNIVGVGKRYALIVYLSWSGQEAKTRGVHKQVLIIWHCYCCGQHDTTLTRKYKSMGGDNSNNNSLFGELTHAATVPFHGYFFFES